ncbi:MAG: hypothetical protein JWM53_3534 [bacterium]|nr:hypothetical protein [bacterium]
MDGRNGFAGKAFSMFLNVDKLVGIELERGLAALKDVAEASSQVAPTK